MPTQAARSDVSSITSVSRSNGADVAGVKRIITVEPTPADESVALPCEVKEEDQESAVSMMGMETMVRKTSQLTDAVEKDNAWKSKNKFYPFEVVELTIENDFSDEAQNCEEDCGGGRHEMNHSTNKLTQCEVTEEPVALLYEVKEEDQESTVSMMGMKTSQLMEDVVKENAWAGGKRSFPFAGVELAIDPYFSDEAQSCQDGCGGGEEKVEDGKSAEKGRGGVEDKDIEKEGDEAESMGESEEELEEEEEEWKMEDEESEEESEEESKEVGMVKVRKRLTEDGLERRHDKRKTMVKRNQGKAETLCINCGRIYNTLTHRCDPKQKFQCPDCGVFLLTELNLSVHKRDSCRDRWLRCTFCLKLFETRQDKLTHEMSHSGKMAYECPECPERFSDRSKRNQHLKEQHPQTFRCQTCQKEFPNNNTLRRHEMSHSTNKPYQCEVCDRGFSQASQLKSHLRVHTGEKPFQCQLCPKRFNHNISLKTHMRRCHQDESHEQDYHSPGSEAS